MWKIFQKEYFNAKSTKLKKLKISAFEGENVISATCGYSHSCVLTSKGEVYSFGRCILLFLIVLYYSK